MKVAIAGGTGFVGKVLVKKLIAEKHEVIVLTRSMKQNNEQITYVQWLSEDTNPIDALQNTDIFINLSGESINSGRWTNNRKSRIRQSRINAVDELLKIIESLERKPLALINASAVGYYGTSEDKVFTESSNGGGTDFLSNTVIEWEKKANEATAMDVRTVLCRFGVILDKKEGALPRMVLPYQFFAGGTVGNGRQWLSWIHIDDVINGILFVMKHSQFNGAVNFTAPYPVTMKEFGQVLGTVLHRPHWLPVPSIALKLLLGEMSTIVLEGQNVLPEKLLENGFKFQYPKLQDALNNIFS